jgi:hypothetical protein
VRVLDRIPFTVDPPALRQRLGLPTDDVDAAALVEGLVAEALNVGRPRVLYDVAEVRPDAHDANGVEVGTARFSSRVLHANLAGIEHVFLYVATCGPELDRLQVETGDLLGDYCRDAIKAAALGAAMNHLTDHLRQTYGLARFATMNPGSGDSDIWPIEQQKALFAHFGDVRGLIGVTLTDSCLMVPNKSVSGLIYATDEDFCTCKLCHRDDCPNRRAPFDPRLYEERHAQTGATHKRVSAQTV